MAVRVPDQITMTSTLDARKRLQEAERHIAERRGFIVAQKRRISELQRSGRNAAGNIALFLRELEASLRPMLDDRGVIARMLRRRGPLDTRP